MALPITQRDQEKLADLANYLMGQGVCVVISNHDTIFTREKATYRWLWSNQLSLHSERREN